MSVQRIDEFLSKVPYKAKKFYYSQWYLLTLVILVFLTWVLKQPGIGFIIGSIILGVGLVIVDDITILFAPILYIPCMINDKNYMVYLPYLAGAVPFIAGAIFHLCYYKPNKNVKAKMLYPQIGVFLAMLLGGCNVMAAEKFKGGIGMTLGLGLAVPVLYLGFTFYYKENPYEKLTSYVAKVLMWYGILLALQVTAYYIINGTSFFKLHYLKVIDIGWSTSNNIATILLITAPMGYYLALTEKKHRFIYTAMSILHYAFIFLSFSRGGMLFGAITGVAVTIYVMIKAKREDRFGIYSPIILTTVGLIIFICLNIQQISELFKKFTTGDDVLTGRDILYQEAINIFKDNPLFGGGMGVRGTSYIPYFKEMTYYWFHSTVLHIMATMGIVGMLAYLWYYIAKYKIVFTNIKTSIFAQLILFGLIGFEGYSMMDTGTFIPYPIMTMVMLIISYIERENEQIKYDKERKEIEFYENMA